MLERTQPHAAPRMGRRGARDIGVTRDERNERPYFGLRCGIRPGAQLLELLPPARRKVAIEIEALLHFLQAHRVTVVVLDRALGQDLVIRAAGLDRIAPGPEARRLGG